VQTLVGRFVSGSGFVLVRQTFVLGGQAVAIRACLWREVGPRQAVMELTRPNLHHVDGPRCRHVVSRLCAGAGLVSDRQTFVFGGQAVAIRV